ncbi:peptidoglycan-binding domain-containing protein [Marinobacter sediminum]|uniref:peptidoglycan-binding domain-containing protein n=1 Tax=Marinobacter sediminum TaxID=256323 RepID=UPI0019399132|nr:peptidoglycan-binding domain-containing protein [Marinobacter sediminum]
MDSAKLSTVSKGLFLSAALAVSSHAQAQVDSVNVIFAAENALYGAGYDIGRADGWMDKALQQGVRDYQARNGALKASGILDAETLSALGVSNSSGRAVSGNLVASKTAALAALGISETQTKPEAKPRHRLQPKPAFSVKDIVPEPEPAPTPVADQQPKPQVQPQSRPTKQIDPATPEATPQVASQTSVTPPAKLVTESSPVPKAQPAPQTVEKPAPSTDLAKVKSPAPETAEPTSAETVAWMKQLPNEATVSKKPEDTKVDEPIAQAPKAEAPETATAEATQKEQPAKPDNDRNIFGSLFHFLFGWMV